VAKIQYTTLSFIKIEEMREKRILFGLILCHVTWSIQGQTAAIREIKLEDIGDNFESSIPIQKLVPGSYVNFLVDLKMPQSTNYENIFRTKFTHNQRIDKVYRSVYIKVKIGPNKYLFQRNWTNQLLQLSSEHQWNRHQFKY